MAHACCFQVDALERDVFEVLRLVQSIKNSLAPIYRIPPDVLSLIPDYYCEDDTDQDKIALTHVCRDWRDIFTSRSSLWTRLDFTNVDKTRTYIQRAQSSPLEIYLGDEDDKVIDDAFPLVIPHISRLKSLTINRGALPSILEHFYCHTPLLERLDIEICAMDLHHPVLDAALFNGDLSSLRELRLRRVITRLPWTNMANLRIFDLKSSARICETTNLLEFFKSAPLLHTVLLTCRISDSPDPPPERIVPLRHLKVFHISTKSPHSNLLRHLHIPAGASLISEFYSDGDESPLIEYLPERSPNISNLSHVTTVNLLFNSSQKFTLLSGPSGSLRVLAKRDFYPSYALDRRILRSLNTPILSMAQGLTISRHKHSGPSNVEECPIFQTLSFTTHLRTLILIACDDQPFIRALDPERNLSNLVLCFNMKELILYIPQWSLLDVKNLIKMAQNRASRGAKLSSITIVSRDGLAPRNELSELGEHVTRAVCRTKEREPPAWDYVPGESGGRVGVSFT